MSYSATSVAWPLAIRDAVFDNIINRDARATIWAFQTAGNTATVTFEGCISFINNSPANTRINGGATITDNSSGACPDSLLAEFPARSDPPPTCLSLPGHIGVYNFTSGTQCRQVDAAGIGNAEVLALGFRDGVDVWGWVLPNTQVCFAGSSGSFRFLDAATAPRAVSELPAYSQNGMVCATIDRAGTVAFLDGPSAPVATDPPPSYQALTGCMVRLQYALNFRDAPDGDVIGAVPAFVTLTALERTSGWFKVDYHGAKGWVSARHVEPMGTCD